MRSLRDLDRDKNLQIYAMATWYKLADNVRKTRKDDPLLR